LGNIVSETGHYAKQFIKFCGGRRCSSWNLCCDVRKKSLDEIYVIFEVFMCY